MKKLLLNGVIILSLFIHHSQYVFAQKSDDKNIDTSFNLQELSLPSDIKDMPKQSGAIYYSTPVRNKVLVPINLWGHIQKPGLHFIPAETSFIKAISATGGPLPGAKLENVYLTRLENGKNTKYSFDLSSGGDERAYNSQVKPGDIIFVKQDRFFENRAYYTSLVAIGVSILTGILLYRQIQKSN